MWLKILHFLGLTNLSDEQVELYKKKFLLDRDPVQAPINAWTSMNAWAFLSVWSLCFLIFGIFFLTSEIIKLKNPDQHLSSMLHQAGFFDSDGSQDKIKTRSYRFWTPAKETRKAVEGKISEEKLRWYTLDNGDKTLENFGSALKERLYIQGYTRTFGWGEGSSPLKPGWSWVVTVTDANSEFTLEKFLSLYKKYFHRDKDIYIEIIEVGNTPNGRPRP